jgi:hypothetical protein
MLAADKTLVHGRPPAFSSGFFYYEKNAVFIVFYNNFRHGKNFILANEPRQSHQKNVIDFGKKNTGN